MTAEPAATDVEGPPGALDVLTIIDLSEGVAGPYAAKLLADCGATVIKVEKPGAGDALRNASEGQFATLNTNKLSLTLDYTTPAGAALLSRLAEDADGILEDWPTRRKADLGLGALTLIDRVPRLVTCGVSAFGDAGTPFSELGPGAEETTGLHTFVAMLAALWYAAQSEHGQVVEVRGIEVVASTALLGGCAPDEGAPFVMTKTPRRGGSAPALGEHTDYVLGDLLGLDAAEIEALRRDAIV